MTTGKATVLYTRLSRALDRDPETGEVDTRNLPKQREELEAEAARMDLPNVRVLVEPGISASKAHDEKRRVFYGELVPMIERGEVGYVLATEVDRLTRWIAAGMRFADLCEDNGVVIHCPGQVTLRPDDDRMLYVIHCSLAESGSKTQIKRAKRWRARERDKGQVRIGGRRMFGWDAAGKVVVAEEGALIKEAVRRVITGEPIYRVVHDWNDRGLKTPGGNRWRPGGLRKNLLSAAHVPTLISEDEHAILEGVLAPGDRDTIKGEPRTRPLTGVLRCERCGAKLIGGPDAYKCAVINGGCGQLSVARFPVERAVVIAAVRVLWGKMGRGEWKPEQKKPSKNVAPLHRELREVKKRAEEIEAAVETGDMPAKTGGRILSKLDADEARLQKQLAEQMPVSERVIPPGAILTAEELQDIIGKRPPKRWFPKDGTPDAGFRERWRAGELTKSEVDLVADFVRSRVTAVHVSPAERPGARFNADRLRYEFK